MKHRAELSSERWSTGLLIFLMGGIASPCLFASPLQGGLPGGFRPDTIQVASNPLEAASLDFARAFAGGLGAELERFLAADGIRLQLDGTEHSGISSRQAVASLREFLRGFEDDRTFLSRASPVDGSPDRGFAEVLWSGRAAGTSDQVSRTLFLGLFRDDEDWRIDELRLLGR